LPIATVLYVTPSYVTVHVPHVNTFVTVTDAVLVQLAVLVPVTL